MYVGVRRIYAYLRYKRENIPNKFTALSFFTDKLSRKESFVESRKERPRGSFICVCFYWFERIMLSFSYIDMGFIDINGFFLVLISKIGLLQSSDNFDFVRPSWVTLAEIKLFLVEDHSVAQRITCLNLRVLCVNGATKITS